MSDNRIKTTSDNKSVLRYVNELLNELSNAYDIIESLEQKIEDLELENESLNSWIDLLEDNDY